MLVQAVMKKPSDTTIRCRLIDFLYENGCDAAARKQEWFSHIINKSIWLTVVVPRWEGYIRHKYFGMVKLRQKERVFEIKADSRIVLWPLGLPTQVFDEGYMLKGEKPRYPIRGRQS